MMKKKMKKMYSKKYKSRYAESKGRKYSKKASMMSGSMLNKGGNGKKSFSGKKYLKYKEVQDAIPVRIITSNRSEKSGLNGPPSRSGTY